MWLAGEDQTIDFFWWLSADRRSLFVGTGPRRAGTYTLTLCGVENDARTAGLRGVTVDVTVP